MNAEGNYDTTPQTNKFIVKTAALALGLMCQSSKLFSIVHLSQSFLNIYPRSQGLSEI